MYAKTSQEDAQQACCKLGFQRAAGIGSIGVIPILRAGARLRAGLIAGVELATHIIQGNATFYTYNGIGIYRIAAVGAIGVSSSLPCAAMGAKRCHILHLLATISAIHRVDPPY